MSPRALLPGIVALTVAATLPAGAQEVVNILNQVEWSVSGVSVSADDYGTCSANDASHADAAIWLQVTETPSQNVVNAVSVLHPGDAQATAAILQIGAERFVLAAGAGDRFDAAAGDGGRIVAAMLKNAGLTLRFDGGGAAEPYAYDLAEFPAAYAALVQRCGAPAAP